MPTNKMTLVQEPTEHLIKNTRLAKPALITRERATVATSLGALASIKRTQEPKTLAQFSLNSIRVSLLEAMDPVPDSVLDSILTKRLSLIRSVRTAAILFLTLNYDYSRATGSEIYIVSHQTQEFMLSLKNTISLFFPSARLVVLGGTSASVYYDPETRPSPLPRSDAGRRYLLSLGVTLEHHRDLVRSLRPDYGLFGIESTDSLNFQFYQGELWIPPFGGSRTRVLYIRTSFESFTDEDYASDPSLVGPVWNGAIIQSALVRFRYITNETVAYMHPELASDVYLYGKYPNDYSHMFVYTTVHSFFTKLGKKHKTAENFIAAFKLLADE